MERVTENWARIEGMQILVKSFGVELFGEDLYEIVRVCALVGRWVCAHVLVRLYVCVRARAHACGYVRILARERVRAYV